MARVLGTAWKDTFLAFIFLLWRIAQHVSAVKDIVVTQPNLCCPKEDKSKKMKPVHF